MATETVSSSIAESKPEHTESIVILEFLPDKTPVVSSRDRALHFQKKHQHILAKIRRIQPLIPQEFDTSDFRPIEIDVLLPHFGGVRKDSAHFLTRDAFPLLALGFTGKAAILWKIRYIEACNALKQAAPLGGRVFAGKAVHA